MKIVNSASVPEVGISHNPDIKKKVFITNGNIPKLTTFGSATFKPGQFVDTHKHDTMFEVFYIQTGRARFTINNQEVELNPGDCLTIEPGETHSQINPYDEDVTWLYFGVAVD
jgi:quercetin dioxygenase-like cupin family protein